MKILKQAPICALLLAAVTACDVEQSDNGHLDGLWQMTSLDSLHNGRTVDMHESGIYWAFQMRLLELRDTKNQKKDIAMRFVHADGQLQLSSPYIVDRMVSDIKVDDPALLHPYGIQQTEEQFSVLHLSSHHMTLQSAQLRLYFRKY